MKKWHEYCLKPMLGKYNAEQKRMGLFPVSQYNKGFRRLFSFHCEEKNTHGHMFPNKIRHEESLF